MLILVLTFSFVYRIKNFLLCKWVLESENGNISISRKPPYWFSNMIISFWLCLFIIKLYSRHDIFNYIRKKHGKDINNIIRSFETLKTRYQKVVLDLKLIKTCKKEELIPKFANVRLSVKYGSAKLKKRISRIIMESEIQVKHQEKKKLKQEIKARSTQLKIALLMLVYTTLLHRINIAAKSRIKSIAKRHEKKLSKFRKRQ